MEPDDDAAEPLPDLSQEAVAAALQHLANKNGSKTLTGEQLYDVLTSPGGEAMSEKEAKLFMLLSGAEEAGTDGPVPTARVAHFISQAAADHAKQSMAAE